MAAKKDSAAGNGAHVLYPRKERVIPAGYTVCLLRLDGITPLLMSSADTDPDSETYRAYRELSTKRRKTQEDEARLRELEWYTRIYFDADLGPFIPGKNIKELLRSAATAWRLGESVKRSLVIPQYRIPLLYDGPRDAAALWAEGYRYTTLVANAGAGSGRVPRTRPCFDGWALETEVAFDPEEINLDGPGGLVSMVERSQKYGLGDYRPEFGAFTATLSFLRQQRADANADAHKPVDEMAAAANGKLSDRLLATA